MTDASYNQSPRLGGQGHIDGREPALTGDRALLHAVELLHAPDEQTRLDAAFALAELGDERAAEHLITILCGEHPNEIKERAALALGPVGEAALPRLIELLHGDGVDIQLMKQALGAVVEHFPEAKSHITPRLIAMVGSGDRTMIGRAVTVMGVVRDDALIPHLVEAARGASIGPFVVSEAMTSLGEMGDLARRPEVLDVLFHWLSIGPFTNREQSTEAVALARIGDPSTLPRALALMRDPASTVGRVLPQLIQYNLKEGAAPHLIRALADPRQAHNQKRIIEALGCTDDERAVDFLLEKLAMPGDVTEEIVQALRWLKRRRAVPALVTVLKGAYRPSVVAECLHALSALDDPSVAPDIVPFLNEPMVGGAVVVEMLERFKYEPAVPALVEALAEPMLRTLAIRALLSIGTESAYRALADHCDHRVLRNARPWARRELWQAYYRWRRGAGKGVSGAYR